MELLHLAAELLHLPSILAGQESVDLRKGDARGELGGREERLERALSQKFPVAVGGLREGPGGLGEREGGGNP